MTKVFDLNESREKGKTTKVAESKLVLGAEFLFTTFTFDLVLTAHVFCVALHQSFGIELFHLRYTVCMSVENLIKNLKNR